MWTNRRWAHYLGALTVITIPLKKLIFKPYDVEHEFNLKTDDTVTKGFICIEVSSINSSALLLDPDDIPYDKGSASDSFLGVMDQVIEETMQRMPNVKVGFSFMDKILLILYYDGEKNISGTTQNIASQLASSVTASFNYRRFLSIQNEQLNRDKTPEEPKLSSIEGYSSLLFDGRVFCTQDADQLAEYILLIQDQCTNRVLRFFLSRVKPTGNNPDMTKFWEEVEMMSERSDFMDKWKRTSDRLKYGIMVTPDGDKDGTRQFKIRQLDELKQSNFIVEEALNSAFKTVS